MATYYAHLAAALIALIPAAALAAPGYVASFANPVSQPKLVSSERVWTCSDSVCTAQGSATSPAQHICSRLAREMGVIASFSSRGEAFTPEALAACNAYAKRPAA